MKKEKFLIAGLLAGLVLVFGLVLASCDDGKYPDTDDYKPVISQPLPQYPAFSPDSSGSGDKIVTDGGDTNKEKDHGKDDHITF